MTEQQMGWRMDHGWWYFSHFRDFYFLSAFSSRCTSCRNYSARIAWLWQSTIFHVFRRIVKQWADTPWGGGSLHQLYKPEMIHHALHKGVMVAKVEAMQMWWWRSGAHGWRQSWRRGRGAYAPSLLLTGRSNFEHTASILRGLCNQC